METQVLEEALPIRFGTQREASTVPQCYTVQFNAPPFSHLHRRKNLRSTAQYPTPAACLGYRHCLQFIFTPFPLSFVPA